jgi:hypothetical protein
MRAHLSDETMTDLLEGAGTPAEWSHVAACPTCRFRLDEARAAVELARGAEVPEPPGLYWEALRRNVSRRIAEEPRAPRLPWSWLGAAAATAGALVVAATLLTHPPAPSPAGRELPAWSALPPVEDDLDLLVVSGFAVAEEGMAEWEEERGLGDFVASLSDEESEALVEALGDERTEDDL